MQSFVSLVCQWMEGMGCCERPFLTFFFPVIPELSALVLMFILQLYPETSPIKVLVSLQELHRHKVAKPMSVGIRFVGFLKRRGRSSERLWWWCWCCWCVLLQITNATHICWFSHAGILLVVFVFSASFLMGRYQYSASQICTPVVQTCAIKFCLLYFTSSSPISTHLLQALTNMVASVQAYESNSVVLAFVEPLLKAISTYSLRNDK